MFVERSRPACRQFVRTLPAIALERRDQLFLDEPGDGVVQRARPDGDASEGLDVAHDRPPVFRAIGEARQNQKLGVGGGSGAWLASHIVVITI